MIVVQLLDDDRRDGRGDRPPRRAEIELGAVLHALSDPVRLKIVAALAVADGEPTCGSFDVPVTKSTCTHHFKVLREAGVIRQRQEGTARLNNLRREDLDARFPGLLATILEAARQLDDQPSGLS
jgi:DNA-binding transcriptional ArsR family regulator